MKENNYFSMFKDRMIVLSVFLYGLLIIDFIIPSCWRTYSNNLWYCPPCLVSSGESSRRVQFWQERSCLDCEFRLSNANGNLLKWERWIICSDIVPCDIQRVQDNNFSDYIISNPGFHLSFYSNCVYFESIRSSRNCYRSFYYYFIVSHHPFCYFQISLGIYSSESLISLLSLYWLQIAVIRNLEPKHIAWVRF